MNNQILNYLIDSSWKKPLILYANQLGLLRCRAVRYIIGINLNDLTKKVIDLDKFQEIRPEKLIESYTHLLNKKWKVKHAYTYLNKINNNKNILFNTPLVFDLISSFLSIQNLCHFRKTCKEANTAIIQRNHFCDDLINAGIEQIKTHALSNIYPINSVNLLEVSKPYYFRITTLNFNEGLDSRYCKSSIRRFTLKSTVRLINKCANLKSLNIVNQYMNLTYNHKFFIQLQSLRDLQSLSIGDYNRIGYTSVRDYETKITDDVLKKISKIRHLKKLELINCTRITNMGLKHLQELNELESLTLVQADSINCIGVKKLYALRNLKILNIHSYKLNFYDINPLIKTFEELIPQLPKLQTFTLTVHEAVIQSLTQKFPMIVFQKGEYHY